MSPGQGRFAGYPANVSAVTAKSPRFDEVVQLRELS
jgi:hypothetical protein